ncbi:MAG: c-type cytochrome biogenesis protein CcmI [Pseudomonadota bacterium]
MGGYLNVMVWFLLFAAALTLAVMLLVLRPMARGAVDGEAVAAVPAGSDASSDTALYRDQLSELDRDLERGVISKAEAEGTRAEIARRLLAAARRAEKTRHSANAPAGLTRTTALVSMAGAPMLAIALYFGVGSPGTADKPLAGRNMMAEAREGRLTQVEAEREAQRMNTLGPRQAAPDQQYADLVTQLEAVVATRPDDVEGHRLLASSLLRLQRYDDAWPVLERLIALRGDGAPADLHAAQAEAMILAAGGYVSREAEVALGRALNLDPQLTIARYYAGHAFAQLGMLDQAVSLWQRLAAEADPDEPWLPQLRDILAQIETERRGADALAAMPPGILGEGLPPNVAPDAAAAVMGLSPEERMAFMAERIVALEERLTEGTGGGPEDWARLVRAYRVLNRVEDARRVYLLSQERLTGAEASFVREQALVDGVIDE